MFDDKSWPLELPGKPLGAITPLADSSGFTAAVTLPDQDNTPAIVTWKFGPNGPARSVKQLKALLDAPENGLITPLKNGRLVWSSSWGDWAVVNGADVSDGSQFDSVTLDTRDTLGVRLDGSDFYFKDNDPDPEFEEGAVFSLRQRAILVGARLPPGAMRQGVGNYAPIPELPGCCTRQTPCCVFKDGKQLRETGEYIYSTEAAPGVIYLGGRRNVYAYDRATGAQKWKTKDLGSQALLLRAPLYGAFVFAYLKDGTFRWISAKTGDLLLSVFITGDRKSWIAWTPAGYYDAGPGGDTLAGYVVARTDGSLRADYYEVSRFAKQYYRPDLVRAALDPNASSTPAPVKPPETVVTRGNLPPKISIQTDHTRKLATARTGIDLTYAVQSDASKVVKVFARVDGAQASDDRGGSPANTIHVDIQPKDCNITLVVQTEDGQTGEDSIGVHWTGQKPSAPAKPTLRLLSIGVTAYKQPGWNRLTLPAKDAVDIENAFRTKLGGGLYGDVKSNVLPNEKATRQGVLLALKALRDEAQPGDFAVIFISGHGVADTDGAYYYLPIDFTPGDYLTSAVSFDDITKLASGIKARTVMFIDTCHSGGITESRLSAIADINKVANGMSNLSNGLVVFTASTGEQNAQEKAEWGNGAFTKAIIEGLSGMAADQDGDVLITGLDGYVSKRVMDLTCKAQTPVCSKKVSDFAIAKAAQKPRPPATCANN
jgi:hypothetical protein